MRVYDREQKGQQRYVCVQVLYCCGTFKNVFVEEGLHSYLVPCYSYTSTSTADGRGDVGKASYVGYLSMARYIPIPGIVEKAALKIQ